MNDLRKKHNVITKNKVVCFLMKPYRCLFVNSYIIYLENYFSNQIVPSVESSVRYVSVSSPRRHSAVPDGVQHGRRVGAAGVGN